MLISSDLHKAFIHNVLLPFVNEHGDKRISPEALEFYRNFREGEVVITQYADQEAFKAISASAIIDGQVKYSITVTSKDFRQRGFGTLVLQEKIEELKKRGIDIKTIVAEDNKASMALCKKVELIKDGIMQRTRSSGAYNAVVWVK
jgi:RimJ/RimL family protein N-acetyltransferase